MTITNALIWDLLELFYNSVEVGAGVDASHVLIGLFQCILA